MTEILTRWWKALDGWLLDNSPRVGGWIVAAVGCIVLADWYRWGVGFALHTAIVFVMGAGVILLGTLDPPRR